MKGTADTFVESLACSGRGFRHEAHELGRFKRTVAADMSDDYYKILEVSRSASQAEIQKAYRDMARKNHPDLNPDDKRAKERFQKIQQAYEVLNDPNKREMYDRYGSSFQSVGAGGGPQWGSPGGGFQGGFEGFEGAEGFDFSQVFGGREGGGFSDIFQHFTGGAGTSRRGRTRGARRRGVDLKHSLTIPFATAVLGGEARVSVERGGGKIETITVKIPPGIDHGKKIRLRGQGEKASEGGTPGDILITIHVAEHPCFHRRGKNLEVRVPVTVAEAGLGTKVDVPTPRGTISLRIPPGTSSGQKLRIRGHGIGGKDGKAGDLVADIQIVLPPSIDRKSADLLRQLGEQDSDFNPRANLQW